METSSFVDIDRAIATLAEIWFVDARQVGSGVMVALNESRVVSMYRTPIEG